MQVWRHRRHDGIAPSTDLDDFPYQLLFTERRVFQLSTRHNTHCLPLNNNCRQQFRLIAANLLFIQINSTIDTFGVEWLRPAPNFNKFSLSKKFSAGLELLKFHERVRASNAISRLSVAVWLDSPHREFFINTNERESLHRRCCRRFEQKTSGANRNSRSSLILRTLINEISSPKGSDVRHKRLMLSGVRAC